MAKCIANQKGSLICFIFIKYGSSDAILQAQRQEVVTVIKSLSIRFIDFANKKYDMLIKCAQDAKHTGISIEGFYQSTVF